ncbi:MAG: MBL fold metallo-hydrolase [Chloroflexi bacterium]|nr:MBL fold metallo-hydrolase [Chloroflexota bacterium]
MSVRLRWLGHACFEIVLPSGKVLVAEPFLDLSPTAPIRSQEVTGADYITISHGAFSAVADVGSLAHRFNSKVVCSYQVGPLLARFFDFDAANLVRVTAGTTITFDDLTIEVRKAEHNSMLEWAKIQYQLFMGKEASPGMSIKELRGALPPHPLLTPQIVELIDKLKAAGIEGQYSGSGGIVHSDEQLDYVLHTSDNLRIYLFFGGPHQFSHQEIRQSRANVIIAHLGGNDPLKMAEVAALSGAEVVIPCCHDLRGNDMARKLVEVMSGALAVRAKSYFLDIVPGKWYEIGARVSAL